MFIAESAQVLEKMLIVTKNVFSYTGSAREEVAAKMKALHSAKWTSGDSKLEFSISRVHEEVSTWSLKAWSNFSFDDPFLCP